MSAAPRTEARASGLLRWCALASLASLVGSLGLAALATTVAGALGADVDAASPPAFDPGPLGFIGVVVFAPLAETLLLSALIALLRRFGLGARATAVVAALAWGGLHGLIAPLWFFGTVWAFFVFATGYLHWRARSYAHAFTAALVPHVLQNLVAFGALAIAG